MCEDKNLYAAMDERGIAMCVPATDLPNDPVLEINEVEEFVGIV
jgi:hypothetical protein